MEIRIGAMAGPVAFLDGLGGDMGVGAQPLFGLQPAGPGGDGCRGGVGWAGRCGRQRPAGGAPRALAAGGSSFGHGAGQTLGRAACSLSHHAGTGTGDTGDPGTDAGQAGSA